MIIYLDQVEFSKELKGETTSTNQFVIKYINEVKIKEGMGRVRRESPEPMELQHEKLKKKN